MTRLLVLAFTFMLMVPPARAGGAVPIELADVDAFARGAVLKTFIELSGVSGTEVYYSNFVSSVGKYGLGSGDFHFSVDLYQSNRRKFHCENSFLRASIDRATHTMTIDQEELTQNSVCNEVTPID